MSDVRPSIRPFDMSRSNLRTPWLIHFKLCRVIGYDGYGLYTFWWNFNFSFRSYGTLFVKLKAISRMSRSNLRIPKPIHFKLCRVVEYDGLTICILCGEISIFHSRVMGLYSSYWRRFFVCRTLTWEPLGQFTSNFGELLDMMVLWFLYILM